MTVRTRSTVLAFALCLAVAVPAAAVIPCQDCEPGMPSSTRCLGFCDGQIIQWCSDWLAFGCDALVVLPAQSRAAEEAEPAAEERFLRSLLKEAPEPVAGG